MRTKQTERTMKVAELSVGQVVVIMSHGDVQAVSEIVKVTKHQVQVRRPGSTEEKPLAPIRYKETKYNNTQMVVIGERSGTWSRHSNTYEYSEIRLPEKDEDLDGLVKEIKAKKARIVAAKKEKQDKQAEKRDEEQKIFEEKVAAFWIYKGKALWESIEDINTRIRGLKLLSYTNERGDAHCMMIRARQEEDQYASFKRDRDGKEKVMEWCADLSGFRVDGYSNKPQTVSHGTIRAKSEQELIYRIVHF